MKRVSYLLALTILFPLTVFAGAAEKCVAPTGHSFAGCVEENGAACKEPAKAIPMANGDILYLVPNGAGTSSLYYLTVRMHASCQQTPFAVQEWDGKKIVTSRDPDEAIGCVELEVNPKTGLIQCDINSGAAMKEEATYRVGNNSLELVKFVEITYLDDTHSKRKTVYRSPRAKTIEVKAIPEVSQ